MRWLPHPYQRRAVRWLLHRPAAGLFLDPGLGKTAITLAAIRWLKLTTPEDEWYGALIVAPLRAIGTWKAELHKWDQFHELNYAVIRGTEQERLTAMGCVNDIHLINPEMLAWMMHEFDYSPSMSGYSILVIDESSKFKSVKAKRWKALRKHLSKFDRRYILTGSPASNSLQDLFAQIYILDRGHRWGQRFDLWQRKFFYTRPYSDFVWLAQDGAMKKLAKHISSICMRAKAKDYLDLPDISFNTVPVKLISADLKNYRQLEKKSFLELPPDDSMTAKNVATRLLKCQQYTSGFVHDYKYDDKGKRVSGKTHYIHASRQEALVDLLQQLGNRQCLIAYWFQEERAHIDSVLNNDMKHTGRVWSESIADEFVTNYITKRWNDGSLRRLLMHAATSHGMNLQGSDRHPVHVIWYGLPWSLEYYEQLNARVHRQGRNNRVIVHHLIAESTVDEFMLDKLKSKAHTAKQMAKLLKRYTIRQNLARSAATEA